MTFRKNKCWWSRPGWRCSDGQWAKSRSKTWSKRRCCQFLPEGLRNTESDGTANLSLLLRHLICDVLGDAASCGIGLGGHYLLLLIVTVVRVQISVFVAAAIVVVAVPIVDGSSIDETFVSVRGDNCHLGCPWVSGRAEILAQINETLNLQYRKSKQSFRSPARYRLLWADVNPNRFPL